MQVLGFSVLLVTVRHKSTNSSWLEETQRPLVPTHPNPVLTSISLIEDMTNDRAVFLIGKAQERQQHRIRRRSRFGCRNCKLRKLKCDEAKPQCRRCLSFGLFCPFLPNTPDMQLDHAAIKSCSRPSVERSVTNAVWTCDSSATYRYELSTRCQDFVTRYLGRSLVNPHDEKLRIVNQRMLGLCFDHPYLMHASIAVALAYDAYLNVDSIPCPSSKTASGRPFQENVQWHWLKATSLFAARLDLPIVCSPQSSIQSVTRSNTECSTDADAIWATAAALVVLSFCIPAATCPSQSWPLHPSAPPDFSWLTMNKGKMSLWALTQPFRPASIFHIMVPMYEVMSLPFPKSGVNDMPQLLVNLCGLSAVSTAVSSPYFLAAHALSTLLRTSDAQVSVGHAERFIKCITGSFRSRLEAKDPVALALMCLWYRKVGGCIWWVGLRARIEAVSIERFLWTKHGHDEGADRALSALVAL